MQCPSRLQECFRSPELTAAIRANEGSWLLASVHPTSGHIVISVEPTEPTTGLVTTLITSDIFRVKRDFGLLKDLPETQGYVGPVDLLGTLIDSPCTSFLAAI